MTKLNISLKRTEDRSNNQSQFAEFAAHLHRGGRWAYTWTKYEGSAGGGDSYWWDVNEESVPNITGSPRNLHVYFSVHPLAEVPRTNKQGESTESHRVRGRIEHVAAINCLFADLDVKDFANVAAFREHIKSLKPNPTAVITTGYGAHLYWFLDEPFPIYQNQANLERAAQLQYRWQQYTKSDPGAKDLARVLRIPGTDNWKHDSQRPCRFKLFAPGTTYTIAELESYLPADTADLQPTVDVKPVRNVELESKKAKMALKLLHPWRSDDRESWVEIGMALTQLGDVGFELWDAWSRQSPKYDSADAVSKWASFSVAEDVVARKPVTLATLYHHARTDAADFEQEDEDTLVALLDKATDAQATIRQRRVAKRNLADRLIWYPADVQDEIRAEAKNRKWLKTEFDKALNAAASDSAGQEDDAAEDVDAVILGESWLRFYPDSIRVNDDWYRYGDGIWQERHDELIYRELQEVARDVGLTPKIVTLDGAVKIARSTSPRRDHDDWNPEPNILVVENGVLDISSYPPRFYEWSNQVYNRVKLPVMYAPEAKAPVYSRVALENFDGDVDVFRFFLSFAGLALAEDARFEVSPWMSGPPGGGKSTILAGVSAVMGGYSANIDLNRLDKYAHGQTMLVDRKLIYATEVDVKFLQNPGILNAIISHEPISINPKNRREFQYTPRCSVIFAVNELPGTANPDSGIYRRVKVIQVAGRSSMLHDTSIIAKIKDDPAERSGMLNLFLEGLSLVQASNALPLPQEIQEATRQWHLDNDKTRLHLEERCDFDPSYEVTSKELYDDFRVWCRVNQFKPYNHSNWAKMVKRLNYKTRVLDGRAIVLGLCLKPKAHVASAVPGSVDLDEPIVI